MAKHPCIFCPKSWSRQGAGRLMPPFSAAHPSPTHRLVAVPVFLDRVSPVLDTCHRMALIDPGAGDPREPRTVCCEAVSLSERVSELKRLGVGTVICGALSEAFANLLEVGKIRLISGVSGEVREVLEAYLNGRLNDERFRMPGFKEA